MGNLVNTLFYRYVYCNALIRMRILKIEIIFIKKGLPKKRQTLCLSNTN